jgi:hypothetical protein
LSGKAKAGKVEVMTRTMRRRWRNMDEGWEEEWAAKIEMGLK